MQSTRIRRPRTIQQALDAPRVADAYNYPTDRTGRGATIGYIELGGGFTQADLTAYLAAHGLPDVQAGIRLIDGATSTPDGANGADGEVMLDVEIGASVAPGARHLVFFAPNTDDGFYDAVAAAGRECQIVSISWGGPENSWSTTQMHRFDALFAALRASGVRIVAAAGDSGSQDGGGDGRDHVDFPASSPNVLGCGGTELTVTPDGHRSTEVTWDVDDTRSATGGGASVVFPGRGVPDVAGNASPSTGYAVRVDGQELVIGGTSAVAPLYAGLLALLFEATGSAPDLLTVVPANPQVCFDVTAGGNGTFRAGPGRDKVTGFGVVDGARLLTVLQASAPPVTPPVTPPAPTPTPPLPPAPSASTPPDSVRQWAQRVQTGRWQSKRDRTAAQAYLDWLTTVS